MEDVYATYQYDRSIDFRTRQALWEETKERYLKRYLGGIVAGLLAIPFGFVQTSEPYRDQYNTNHLYVFGGILVLIVSTYKLIIYQNDKRKHFREHQLRANKMASSSGRIEVRISEEGMYYSNPFASGTISWSQYHSFYVSDGYIFLITSVGNYVLLSAENLGDERFEKICDVLPNYLKGGTSRIQEKAKKKRRDDLLDN